VRATGNIKDPGLVVSGSLTYDTAEGAQAGAQGIESVNKLASVFAFTGLVPRIQGLDVKQADATVAVDVRGRRRISA